MTPCPTQALKAPPLRLGAHLSIANGLVHTAQDAIRIGAGTFQCFLRNPRGARSKHTSPAELSAFHAFLNENRLMPIVVHAAYTMNLCSPDEQTRERSAEMLTEDLSCMAQLPGNFYNLHPGSRVTQPRETAIRQIADAIHRALPCAGDTVILLETMAGKGSEIGGTFQDLADILALTGGSARVGVCMDSCHMYDAGYDIAGHLDAVLEEFDRIVGLSRLYVFHLNDSKNPCGSHKDRHALCGNGVIGLDAIVRILTHPVLRRLPMILETPTDTDGHAAEIALLQQLSS